ncbi:hypothetical protein GOP47_0007280 [Adiantum capillus-veneris]|uniref:Nicotinamide-nucleotide adenylyltransferase n=1 Tax=Adiantum capillus-veneris TaxID=13818 RepID=A0A9D4ZLD4_ADICA|nr:hypothetical protein GOP47_0007280 [Adiantum capillus-veneris]
MEIGSKCFNDHRDDVEGVRCEKACCISAEDRFMASTTIETMEVEELKGDEEDLHAGLMIPLPLTKLNLPSTANNAKNLNLAVLVAAGSFNPPTYMHLHMFESGREALLAHGYHVMGGYMSPANSAYVKQGLISAEHRIRMCQLVAEGSSFIMVDPWEALQTTYQRTLKVLARVTGALQHIASNFGSMRVFLLCGADLLESFTIPGVWLPDHVEKICRDYGLVCLHRGGRNLRNLIQNCELLAKHQENIIVVDNFESEISSTRVRENLSKLLPVDDLTPTCVIDYITSHGLYNVPQRSKSS